MRPEDWARLAQAALTVVQAMRDEKVISISEQVAKHGKSDTVARAVAGLRIAERIGLCRAPARVDDETALDIERVSEEMRRGAVVTCALPPLNQLSDEYIAPLLSLCATIGATTKIN
jgi:hypothetical protein